MPVFPGVFRFGRSQPAVAGAEDYGNVPSNFTVGWCQSGIFQGAARGRNGIADI